MDQSIHDIAAALTDSGITIRMITPDDCDVVRDLPFIHKDPFDRVLIAQAITDEMTIVTKDQFIPQYNVRTVWDS